MDAKQLTNTDFQEGGRRRVLASLVAFFPIVIVVVLTVRSLQDASFRIEVAEGELAQSRYRAINTTLNDALSNLASSAWQTVAGMSDPGQFPLGLRGLVTRGFPLLAVIYEAGERVYPPRDSVASTPGELFLFQRLSSQIRELMRRAYEDGESLRWLYFDGSRGLLLCRGLGEGDLVACVLLSEEDTNRQLLSSVAILEDELDGWRVHLIDATGRTVTSTTGAPPSGIVGDDLEFAPAPMSGVMSGWQLRLRVPERESAISDTSSLVTTPYVFWGTSFCAFWLLLVWHLYHRHATELKRSRERATLAALLSHDLRTPLANVRLYTDLIRRDAITNSKVRAHTDVIEQALDRLENITRNTVALVKGGMHASQDDTFNPDEAISQQLALYAPELLDAGISVDVSASSKRITMARSTFDRVLSNLIDNACKHAPGRPVHISTELREGSWCLTFRDHGPGPANLPNGKDTRGLGLRSIRTLVDENGGALTLEEANPGLRVVACFRVGSGP